MPESSKSWGWTFDLVTMIAVLVGLTFGAIELRQIRNAQETEAVLRLFETIQTEGYNRGATLIFQLPDTISTESLRAGMSTPEGNLLVVAATHCLV